MESLFTRILQAIIIGILTGLCAVLVLVILAMLAPSLDIDASWWGTLIGIFSGVYVFLTGSRL